MTHDWITTLLALGFFAATAAFFVMWSKHEEQKQKTAEEHTAYRNALEYGNAIAEAWRDEHANYMAALQIANDSAVYSQQLQELIEQGKLREKCQAESVLWFADQLKYWKEANEDKAKDILYYHKECKRLKNALEIEMERTSRLDKDCAQLEQNLRSALRCPHNDHVWKDGRCVKCGRVKDAAD